MQPKSNLKSDQDHYLDSMFLCCYLQVKLLPSLCLRPEIYQIIRCVPLIYAFQIPEDIDQSPDGWG